MQVNYGLAQLRLMIETCLAADIDVCKRRYPRGLYKKARAGEIPDFTGISAPYETPDNPTIKLDTGFLSVEQSIMKLLESVLPRLHDGRTVR